MEFTGSGRCIVWDTLYYDGVSVLSDIGTAFKKNGEAVGSAIFSSIVFFACVVLVLLLVMMNFDSVINPATNEMKPFPAVAAVDALWPTGSWTYAFIIFIGIFTTSTGFLWSINHIFFERKKNLQEARYSSYC